jgi:hypothetical protein
MARTLLENVVTPPVPADHVDPGVIIEPSVLARADQVIE